MYRSIHSSTPSTAQLSPLLTAGSTPSDRSPPPHPPVPPVLSQIRIPHPPRSIYPSFAPPITIYLFGRAPRHSDCSRFPSTPRCCLTHSNRILHLNSLRPPLHYPTLISNPPIYFIYPPFSTHSRFPGSFALFLVFLFFFFLLWLRTDTQLIFYCFFVIIICFHFDFFFLDLINLFGGFFGSFFA